MSQQPPQSPQWQPTNPPVPPVRQSWFARHKALSVALGVTLLVVVICCGAGVATMAGGDSTTGTGSETSQAAEGSEETTTEDATGETTTTEETEPAPAEEATEGQATEDEAEAPAGEMTTEQENAVRAAENYLELMPFSKEGLIEQLSSPAGDDYPQDVATFAVEHIESDVDWNEQAVKAAESYLDLMSFSRSGLIEQLTSDAGDGYTREQAEYAADQVGL
ncbi:Ltp family lipoprotein [Janibacter sp. DB-40]|uniref:Ltp family lipoprotein n=1 Tax=Janibacter sp. DB-40 TaxID=3028808 RepID=UPI0024075BEE|nr:Ltp family lipoprotein [Janibacter sp. DB-40]